MKGKAASPIEEAVGELITLGATVVMSKRATAKEVARGGNARLRATAAYPAPKTARICFNGETCKDCCKAWHEARAKHALAELPARTLFHYAYFAYFADLSAPPAMAEYKHYLPRILERLDDLAAQGSRSVVIGQLLRSMSTTRLTPAEDAAIDAVIHASWEVLLESPTSTREAIADLLQPIANRRDDLGWYLDAWSKHLEEAPTPLDHAASYVAGHYFQYDAAGHGARRALRRPSCLAPLEEPPRGPRARRQGRRAPRAPVMRLRQTGTMASMRFALVAWLGLSLGCHRSSMTDDAGADAGAVVAVPSDAVAPPPTPFLELGSHRFRVGERPNRTFYSPDGATLFTLVTGRPHGIRAWDVHTGKERWSSAEKETYAGLGVGPDGALYVARWEGRVEVLDPANGNIVRTIATEPAITDLALSPDGTLVATWRTNSASHSVEVFDAATGARLQHLERPGYAGSNIGGAFHVGFAGSLLVSAAAKDTIVVWDPKTGKELRTIPSAPRFFVSKASTIAIVDAGDRVRLVDASNGKSLGSFKASIWSATFDAAGKRVAVATTTRSGAIYDPSGKLLATIPMQDASSLAFSPDDRVIASGGSGAVELFDGETGKSLLSEEAGHKADVIGLKFAGAGADEFLASEASDKTIRLWDPKTGTQRRVLPAHGMTLDNPIAITRDGALLACSRFDLGNIVLYDPRTGEERGRLVGARGADDTQHNVVEDMAFSPDGRTLVSAEQNGRVSVWDVEQHARRRSFKADFDEYQVGGLTISNDARLVAVSDGGGARPKPHPRPEPTYTQMPENLPAPVYRVGIWDTTSSQRIGLLPLPTTGPAHRLLLSPSGDELTTANLLVGKMATYDVKTASVRITYGPPQEGASKLVGSANGRVIVTAGIRDRVSVWNAATGALLTTFPSSQGNPAVALSADGSLLAVGSGEGIVTLWKVPAP